MQRKLRTRVVGTLLVAMMALGFAPAAYAQTQDNDVASAIGGHGGNGGIAAGIGVCAIQISLVGSAGCANNGVADASGGNGGNATAYADNN